MKYPIGIQNFGEIRRGGYAYVDKTALMYKLVSEGKYYFLSRPRRFGKSLLLSTLEAYFEGKKELFEGLAVSSLEKEWKAYPILHLDLNTREYKDESSLHAELNRHLEGWEKQYGDTYKDRATEERFIHVINNVYEQTGKQVVILVDEYDKPLLQAIGNEPLQSAYRSKLKAFYSVVKTLDAKVRQGERVQRPEQPGGLVIPASVHHYLRHQRRRTPRPVRRGGKDTGRCLRNQQGNLLRTVEE